MKSGKAAKKTTAADRIQWLLSHRYGGSRSEMARATGVSLTGLIKVFTDQQMPGRRMLETIIKHTDVSPAWLFAGEGHPFRGSSIPVSRACLSGPPDKFEDNPLESGVSELADLYSPSRYWLMLASTEPAVRSKGNRLAAGDLMLMETARRNFPSDEHLSGRWGVVRVPDRNASVLRLAELTYIREGHDSPAFLEAETFMTHPMRVRRLVVDELPSGKFEVSRRTVFLEQPKGGVGDESGQKSWSDNILGHDVKSDDVVAICLLLVRRFGQTG